MDYATSYFGKPLEELEYQDIENFFTEEKEESDKIEFKAYSATYGNFTENIKGVIRGICALLNSEGGIIIWGAPEGRKPQGRNEKIFQGALSPVKEYHEKDKMINKVSDNITPLPVAINLKVIQQGTDYLYIFEVQPSIYKPHQYNNTYWARLDGQTKPAPHYLIEALFRRISYPNIEGFVAFNRISYSDDTTYYLQLTVYIFNFSPLHNEENVTYQLLCGEYPFTRSNDPDRRQYYGMRGQQFQYKEHNTLHFGSPIIWGETLMIDVSRMRACHHTLNLILSFGGKNSPMKTSTYKLNLENIDWNKPEDLNGLIVEIKENKLIVDVQKALGTTRESTLSNVLNR